MNQLSSHRQWLYLNFPEGPVSLSSDMSRPEERNNLRGRRVWAKQPIVDWQFCDVIVTPEVGGTIASHGADDVFVVRWDSGRVAMHRKDDLLRSAVLIGGHESLKSYLDGMRAHACKR